MKTEVQIQIQAEKAAIDKVLTSYLGTNYTSSSDYTKSMLQLTIIQELTKLSK